MYGAPKPSASSPNPPKPYNCCANTKDDDWAGLSEPIDPAQEPDQDQQSTDTDDDIGVDEAQLDTEPAADPPARVPELAATHSAALPPWQSAAPRLAITPPPHLPR